MTKEKFISLTKAERRVHIAKDICKSLKDGSYKALQKTYIRPLLKGDIKENLNKIETCHVCMVGATLLSTVKVVNTLTGENIQYSSLSRKTSSDEDNKKIYNILNMTFSAQQLHLIEACFDGDLHMYQKAATLLFKPVKEYKIPNALTEILQYKKKFKKSNERMLAICENIIRNKGTFKIKQDL